MVERIFGIDLTADVTVAQMHAGTLFHPLRVDEALALCCIVWIVLGIVV